jgi:hypothetical protein
MFFMETGLLFFLAASSPQCAMRKDGDKEMFACCQAQVIEPQGYSFSLPVTDMKDLVTKDFENVPGVTRVKVAQSGPSVRVDIAVRDLEFETCKPLYEKEMDLYSQFDHYDFDFNIKLAA